MKRNHSTFSRSESPAGVPNQTTRGRNILPQVDGGCLGKPDIEATAPTTTAAPLGASNSAEDKVPSMPHFLQLTQEEMDQKFAQIVALENERLQTKNDDPSLNNEWARLDPDPVLDRYVNIHPWANNRILLQVPEGVNNYINASPINLVSTAAKQSEVKKGIQDKYICMQGPKKETVDHTYHMLWHELAEPYSSTPAVIIQLSAMRAAGPYGGTVEKVYPYFPLDEDSEPLVINETGILGDDFHAEVRFVSKEPPVPGSAVEIRQLAMSVLDEDEEEKPIWHFLYPSWPDFGALDENNVASIISLMELSRQKNGRQENARIVHCSAGVGRTGTFVALEFLVGELHGGAWEGWKGDGDPVYETVDQLRQQRRTMVQSFEQFKFLYEVLRKMWEEKYHTPCVGGDHNHRDDSTVHGGEHDKTLVYENGTAVGEDCADASVDGDKDEATSELELCAADTSHEHAGEERCSSVGHCTRASHKANWAYANGSNNAAAETGSRAH